jgi:hypothetical protein
MPLTRDANETIRKRVQRDSAFRDGLLQDAIECMLNGEIDVGKTILRDFIKATVGFENLGQQLDKKPESLVRMFGPSGNPTIINFFQVISFLRQQEGLQFGLKLIR